MPPVDVDSLTDRQRARFEEHRGRDFYRYYEAFKSASTGSAPTVDLFDPVATSQHRPRSGNDKALTAFCQLTALRVDARRSMLFFFDKDNAYVLAEATRTLSLVDDTHFEAEDALWLGHTIIPRGLSVCEHTVNIPYANHGSNRNDANADTIHIINDLADTTTFCDRPFVTAGPRARFYAGVPILSPEGNRIGALCVLDDKPRDGLDAKSITFMADMAKTVIDHLEMVRERLQHARGMEMVQGLGAFIERAAFLRQSSATCAADLEKPPAETTRAPPRLLKPYLARGRSLAAADGKPSIRVESPDALSGDAPASDPASDGFPASSNRLTIAAKEDTGQRQRPAHARVRTQSKERPRIDIDQRIQETFQRAARLVRRSIAVDSVAFVDASVTGFAKHSDDGKSALRAAAMDSEGLTSTASDCSTDDVISQKAERDNACAVLGSSLSESSADEEKQLGIFPQSLVDRLLRRHPLGKIWTFGDTDDSSSSSQEEDIVFSSATNKDSTPSDGTQEIGGTPAQQKSRRDSIGRRRRSDKLDAREIQRLFPGAKSVALIGIWDLSRSRWYAAGFLWTRSQMRVLSHDGEMHYLSAFCDIVMTEIHRIDTQHEGQVKSDFISSLSHELRSPLHGILGTAECLQDTQLAQPVSDMVEQIENCGRTLLDVIEHLLDYSMVNNYRTRRTFNAAGRHSSTSRALRNPHSRLRHRGPAAADPFVHLDKITEDVVDASVYSFCYTKNGNAWQSRDIKVHLDIERLPDAEWYCKLSPGAWRRVCMNIVNNALKYTQKGYIKISLKQSTSETGRREGRRKFAVFSVTDTGQGMSRDFLENHYFQAFAQEDSFFDGIGLGMSLVAKIVKSFRGQVNVKSEKGSGTTVEVKIPLNLADSERNEVEESNATRPPLEGLTFDFLGAPQRAKTNDSNVLKGSRLVFDGLVKTCQELGAQMHVSSRTGRTSEGIGFIFEQEFRALHHKARTGTNETEVSRLLASPLIVLCNSAMSMRSLRASCQELHGSAHFLTQPFGPGKLTKAIATYLSDKDIAHSQPQVLPSAAGINQAPAPPTDFISPCKAASHDRGCICNSTRISEPIEENTSDTPSPCGPQVLKRSSSGITDRRASLLSPSSYDNILLMSRLQAKPEGTSDSSDEIRGGSSSSASTPPTDDLMQDPLNKRLEELSLGVGPAGGGLSMQLVDDNAINLQILTAFAKKNGHASFKSENGATAVEAYTQAAQKQMANGTANVMDKAKSFAIKPQVILMDINMPVMNGFEATRRIRAFERQQQKAWQKAGGLMKPALIIALTGLGSEEAMREGYASGMDMFLTKPVRLQELKKILSEANRVQVADSAESIEDGKGVPN